MQDIWLVVVTFLNSNLTDLSSYLFDANKRIYSVYLISAVLMAFYVFYKTKPSANFLKFLFPKRVWLAKTAKQDYILFFSNKFIKSLLIAPLLISMTPIAIGFSDILENTFGFHGFISTSATTVALTFTLVLFLFDDFSRFLLHFLLHKIPFLWSFHQVHHSAKVLTPMTIYRSHPIENLLYALRMTVAQGLAVGLCYYLFGPTLKMVDILGANLFIFVFNVLGSNLRHSHIWFTWPSWLESWLISPAQHQIHHSSDPKHFDANFGTALAIWDKWVGSLIKSNTVAKPKNLRLGVAGASDDLHASIFKLYWQPFADSARCIKSIFDKRIARLSKVMKQEN
ncbi:sterol desaturase family protein [Catenovulum sp. SM1970]|uniref:sterol desaturase family protein n=1 Tax=Marinifaba aquimaris TaxID=2741323 RepID=UPI0015725AC3|nr:sterol desaturase family protein [Marinifaba aquimaris]NTS76079.1 sterol desaturase family protein [Marinifaba aquimaris]